MFFWFLKLIFPLDEFFPSFFHIAGLSHASYHFFTYPVVIQTHIEQHMHLVSSVVIAFYVLDVIQLLH